MSEAPEDPWLAERDLVGHWVSDHYLVERLIGEGQRKRTYLARDTRVKGRRVALSVVRPRAIIDDPFGTQREADILALIGSHPNIVNLHETVIQGAFQCIVFEYLPGGTLADYVARLHQDSELLAFEQILRIGRQLARALSQIHRSGVIHRDVSARNVLLDERSEAHLGDFDAAVLLGSNEEELPPLPNDDFASPEERKGEGIDTRTDLYSLGRVIAFLITGDSRAGRAEVESAKLRSKGSALLMDLAVRLLADEPNDRPPDADQVLRRLNDARAQGDSGATRQ